MSWELDAERCPGPGGLAWSSRARSRRLPGPPFSFASERTSGGIDGAGGRSRVASCGPCACRPLREPVGLRRSRGRRTAGRSAPRAPRTAVRCTSWRRRAGGVWKYYTLARGGVLGLRVVAALLFLLDERPLLVELRLAHVQLPRAFVVLGMRMEAQANRDARHARLGRAPTRGDVFRMPPSSVPVGRNGRLPAWARNG